MGKIIFYICILLFGSHIEGKTFILNETFYLDSPVASLDLTKECPKLSTLYLDYDPQSDWRLLRDYYLNQNNDLGLSKNKNLKHVEIYATELFPFFLKSYLPQVTSLYTYAMSSHWEALASFPNLKRITCIARAPLVELATYNPHITTIAMWTSQFEYFSNEELKAISQLKELKNLKYEINWNRKDGILIQEKQKEVKKLFPKINIQLIMNEPHKEND